ncbi:thioredoxin domain-containing protein [Thiolapillus sp.]
MTRTLPLLLLLLLSFPAAGLQNQLANNPSPYLAMHGEDPVHWQVWSAKTLELARKEGKLLFVSSGYFACHWCHVMQRESYQNAAIAELLNTLFIPVKVDRELNPALDEHLIDFVQRTQGRAGWPLNVFLTPEGYPLVGMTYVPPERFRVLLGRLQKMWHAEKEEATELARQALEALVAQRQSQTDDTPLPNKDLQQSFLKTVMLMADELAGGFGQQNRFPMTPQLTTLLEIQARRPTESVEQFLRLTLDQMAAKGLRDHLAGGFFRYTVDPDWRVPHYEKMLYTQALLASLYLRAADVFKQPEYARVAQDTLEFTLREMCGNSPGCVASFSAVDAQGVEGGYYLWKEKELKQVLDSEQLELAQAHWLLDDFENRPEGVLPMLGVSVEQLARQRKQPVSRIREQLAKARKRLLKARSERSLPVDDKRLAGWNGLLLTALTTAADQLRNQEFRTAANRLRDYLLHELWNGRELFRAVHNGKPMGQASVADYAYVVQGLRNWAKISNSSKDLELANRILRVAWSKFHTDKGWLSGSQALLPGMPSVKAQEDGALPSATALIMSLSLTSDDEQLRSKAKAVIRDIRLAVQDNPFWYASHVNTLLASPANRK